MVALGDSNGSEDERDSDTGFQSSRLHSFFFFFFFFQEKNNVIQKFDDWTKETKKLDACAG